jgi:hypothetical protein
LRQEGLSFSRVLANLYEGLLTRHVARIRGSEESIELASARLLDARHEARDHRLRPYQLAADDALAEIHAGRSLGLLADRMEGQNVVRPDLLKRLYTVDFE